MQLPIVHKNVCAMDMKDLSLSLISAALFNAVIVAKFVSLAVCGGGVAAAFESVRNTGHQHRSDGPVLI